MSILHHFIDHLLSHTIDYCERHDLTFWAEPVNALTNIGFLLVAWYSWCLYKSHIHGGPHTQRIRVLVLIAAAIGVGSFAFHTFASMWACILDLLPIALFIFAYLRILLLHIFAMRRQWVISVSMLFVAVSAISALYLPATIGNGSSGYVASLVLFSSIVMTCYQKRMPHADEMLYALLLFWTSLFLRTMDMSWCPQFPLGTHFLWHLLNAVVLTFMMRFLIFNLSTRRT